MPTFIISARVTSPRIFAAQIPRKLSLELEKPRYRRMGIILEQISVEELK